MSVERKMRSRRCVPQPILGDPTGIKYSRPLSTNTRKRTSVWYVCTRSRPQHPSLTPYVLLCSSFAALPCCPGNSTNCVTSTRTLVPVELGSSLGRVRSLVLYLDLVLMSLLSCHFSHRELLRRNHARSARYWYFYLVDLRASSCRIVYTRYLWTFIGYSSAISVDDHSICIRVVVFYKAVPVIQE